MNRIRGTTRLVAILGDPVEHSRSPAMHNAAFAALRLDYVYVALRVRPDDLRRAITGVRALGFAGLNVTVPHKQAVLPLLDRLAPAAREIGAVNTVVRENGRLVGHNTDAEGFRRAVRALGFRGRGRAAVLLGAGGSARAVAWALAGEGLRRMTILNRDVARASALARDVRAHGGPVVEVGPLDAAMAADTVGGADLIVNCTSLGLDGKSSPRVAIAATPDHCLFYDLVYGARPTPFLRSALRGGRRTGDGLGMLLEQAGLAFHIWTGRRAPLDVMRAALRS
ncbi:MAG: shikimate dehydrogenase [Deltaproteobacteria bacterium]|nr:shikimate dehydrogenase [Deltaproteobacteria bacterium]